MGRTENRSNHSGRDDSSSNKQEQLTIRPDLSKKILNQSGCDKRIPYQTAEAISEVLRMFVVEARARATIEVRQNVQYLQGL